MKYLSAPYTFFPFKLPIALNVSGLLPLTALFAAAMLWGGSFAAMRLSVEALNPWSVMWLRMVVAFVVILPFAARFKFTAYQRGDWRLLVPMVLFQPCIYFLLESYALKYTTSSQAGVISASVPLMVAVGAGLILKESLGGKSFFGLFLSMGGVAVLSLADNPTNSGANPLLGNALELFAMASAALNMILVKRLCDRYNPWQLTALQVFTGTIFFTPGLFLLLENERLPWTMPLVCSILFLSILVTLGAFGLYNWAMSRIPASKASVFINLVPVMAVIIGWTTMGETLSQLQGLAAVGVIFGVVISQKGS
jgi:drug/metabolite transporter (DMT)-like permease